MPSKAKAPKRESRRLPRQDDLGQIAENTLMFFENASNVAREGLSVTTVEHPGNVFSSGNTMVGDRAVQNLAHIKNEQIHELAQLAVEPAIARLVLRGEDEKDKVYFIARAGILPPSK